MVKMSKQPFYKTEGSQRIYLIIGIVLFVSVVYFSSVKKLPSKSTWHHLNNKSHSPNFIFILTDDQDNQLNGMLPMRKLQEKVGNFGVSFSNAFVASPLCCPSRSSILTGQYVHNHGVVNNSLSGQCSGHHWQIGPEKKTFAAHLHSGGYRTFFAGKYLNQYGSDDAGGIVHIPVGWDWWYGLKGNSKYYNYTLSVNGTSEHHGEDLQLDYLTSVIRERALQFLHNSGSAEEPFFMMLSLPAPHAPFTPESKYVDKFSGEEAPRTKNFNIKNGKDKHWLLRLGEQPLNDDIIIKVDKVFRNRLRTLLTVDDMVDDIVSYLYSSKLLDNTYIVFTSDNGYHLGQFSLPLDKREPYEFDIRVPLMVRGPGIAHGIIDYPVSNVDLAPTFLDLADLPVPKYMDGRSLKSVLLNHLPDNSMTGMTAEEKHDQYLSSQRKTLLIEHSGEGHKVSFGCEYLGSGLSGCNPDFACKCEDSWNNSYSCFRRVSKEENILYCVWEDSEMFEEVYDVAADPFQLNNTIRFLSKQRHKKFRELLKNFSRCRGVRCSKLSAFVL